MPNYEALTEHLNGIEDAEVTLSFAQLDRIVGGLPASARKRGLVGEQRQLTVSRPSLDHARRNAHVDFVADQVRFVRGVVGGAPRQPLETKNPARVVDAPVFERIGEPVESRLRFEWLDAGVVTLVAELLKMPVLGIRPGIYRFESRGSDEGAIRTYVGEAENLERRMGNYRNPGSGQPTNLRLNQALRDTLVAGGSVAVSVVLAGTFDGLAIDLASKPGRLLIENAALVALGAAGADIENL